MISRRKKSRFERLRQVMIRLSGLDVMENTRRRDVTIARTIMANELYDEGMRDVEIAELMGKHRTTVLFYLGRGVDMLNTPGWEAERELWEKFKKEI